MDPSEGYSEGARAREPAATWAVAEAMGATRSRAEYRRRGAEDGVGGGSTEIGRALAWISGGDS